jgi:malate synthase
MSSGIEITKDVPAEAKEVLTPEALEFVASLHRTFNPTREGLLAKRQVRQEEIAKGDLPHFLPETKEIRESSWQVAPTPPALQDRRVEITGPADRKMMINALNSGSKVFMVDFEDALSPTWYNVTVGQRNVMEAVRRTIEFDDPSGKSYRLNDEIATLLIRPRGWHLTERHVTVDGESISASIFDFGLSFFHNAREQLNRGVGPYYYLPKLQSHLEARLWNDVFNAAQDQLGIPHGSIRATVLIETIHAAFEMEEILYELRDHSGGLNAGRWDYIFSLIKTLRERPDFLLPDRAQVTMAVPFMRAYTDLLVQTCHKRGAHAIGGMAAFIPTRRDPEVNQMAFAKVREDKEREANAGFDGTWIAHPGLVEVAQERFDAVMDGKPNQKDRLRKDVHTTADNLLNTQIEGGKITDAGVRTNVSVALQYIDSWLRGIGAAAIYNLMEDAATAEISRAQLWQWINHLATTDDGEPITRERFKQTLDEELAKLGGPEQGRLGDAAKLLDSLVRNDEFIPFLTLPAYQLLD